MILLYHKVDLESLSQFWVDIDTFYRQMTELRNKQVVYLDQYDPSNPDHVVITFDDVYENVFLYAAPILKKFGYPYELFIIGDMIGRDNSFDSVEPLTNFATKKQLQQMVKEGARLQWHTRTHPDLAKVESESKLAYEYSIPKAVRQLDPQGFNWFAYPYGNFSPPAYEVAKQHFDGALSCIQGSDHDSYAYNRLTVVNSTSFSQSSTTVIIPSFNYGRYLVEAVESVINQTWPANQIIIVDDGSSDDTSLIGERYQEVYPQLVTFIRHKTNLGIIKTFNEAVRQATGEYVCILDADNRYRSDFLEKTSNALDTDPNRAIAYTDFAFFGQRAEAKYALFPKHWQGGVKLNRFFVITFPDFTPETKKFLKQRNFMHGNSLFRKEAFLQTGGYRQGEDRPEDHSLFYRMIQRGWTAVRVPLPLLEYRQHTRSQENDRFNYFAQLHFYRTSYKHVLNEKRILEMRLQVRSFWESRTLTRILTKTKSGGHMVITLAKKVKRKVPQLITQTMTSAELAVQKARLAGRDTTKLHLGCGGKVIPGWLNVDIDSSFGSHVYALDLRKPFPFPSNKTKRVFVEHTIENLTKEECQHFFAEVYRVLKPKGVMRIGISDISKLMKAYATKDKKYRALMQTDMQPLMTDTWDEFLMSMLFNWHRRSYFSYPLLKLFLEQAGFKKVTKKKFGQSDFDFNFDSRPLPDNVYIEAQKL